MSTDSYGDVVGGNSISDFLKYIPGIQVSGEQFESESVFVRGFPSNFTAISADGAQMATSQVSGNSRNFNLVLSINNYSRVEVTKVPTPATAADTMSGSVNMISKNSFERSKAEFRYQVNLTGNSNHLTLKKEPFITETKKYRINPGFSFDYTLPVNDRLGFVVTGAHSNTFNDQVVDPLTYRASGTGTGASPAAPFLGQWVLTDAPQYRYRSSLGLRADWRVSRHGTLSVGYMNNLNRMVWGNSNVNINAGTVGTPNPVAGGIPLTYSDTFTRGATGRGSFTYNQTHLYRSQANRVGNFRYRLDDGEWMVQTTGSISRAKAWFRDAERGTFGSITAGMKFPVRVEFLDIDPSTGRPGQVRVFNNANQAVDPYDPANFNITATNIAAPRNIRVSLDTWAADVKRRLNFLPFPASLQIGGAVREEKRDIPEQAARTFTYQGPNGDQSSAPYLAKVYVVQRNPFDFNGAPLVPQLSPRIAYEAWQEKPSLFVTTPAQQRTEEVNRLSGSEAVKEKVESLYLQPEVRLFRGRLTVLTGVRYEKTTTGGKGLLQDANAVFVRDPDGTFAHNAAGQRIRKPEAGAAGSMEETKLIYTERGFAANRTYDGFYPSLHLTYNATEKFLIRAAYAKTYGRPLFTDIIPRAVINEGDFEEEPDPGVVRGTIDIRNTALRPWTAQNYDLSLEYYTDRGGLFGASVFHKEIQDFHGTFAKVATLDDLRELQLDEAYVGWQVQSRYNLNEGASVSGLELSASQSLHRLGSWGQHFKAFANFTKLKLKGDRDANFSGFLPMSANWGITFTKKKYMIGAKWNHRGEQDRGAFADFGPDAREYWPARTTFDLNLNYNLRPNLTLFLNARDVFDKLTYLTYRRGPDTPDYARHYRELQHGTPFSIGVKGSF